MGAVFETSPEQVVAPEGTFMGRVQSGTLQMPAPVHRYCMANTWTLLRTVPLNDHCIELQPVGPEEDADGDEDFVASLSADGKLWIPGAVRQVVGLKEQSVFVRVEGGVVRLYLRKVFETLGFGP